METGTLTLAAIVVAGTLLAMRKRALA